MLHHLNIQQSGSTHYSQTTKNGFLSVRYLSLENKPRKLFFFILYIQSILVRLAFKSMNIFFTINTILPFKYWYAQSHNTPLTQYCPSSIGMHNLTIHQKYAKNGEIFYGRILFRQSAAQPYLLFQYQRTFNLYFSLFVLIIQTRLHTEIIT